MHEECVDPRAAALLGDLAEVADDHDLLLGGGTACALRLGHRRSRNLDFFSLTGLDPTALLRDLPEDRVERLRGISSDELVVVLDGVQVSAASLGREPLEPPDEWNGIDVLSPFDLAELKVDTAVSRGAVRDLCDLHLLCLSGVDLEDALRESRHDPAVAMEALADPERFAGQPRLDLLRPWSLEEAIAYFTAESRRLLG